MKDYLTRDYTEREIANIAGYPVPPKMKIRPVHALRSALALKANKEDTRQVYEVTNALSGSAPHEKFRKFVNTDYGRRVVETPIKIEKLLCDHERLTTMPGGSVGRVYAEFMKGDGLSEEALLQATRDAGIDYTVPNPFPEFSRQVIHFKVTHDLWHL